MAKKSDGPIEPRSYSDFMMVLDKFTAAVGSTVEMACREQMHLICRDAMNFTPPMPAGGGRGLTDSARNAGRSKVARDIRRIFIPQDQPVRGRSVFLRQIINAVKGNDTQTFFKLHQDVTPSKISSLSPIMRKIMDDTSWVRAQAKAKNYLNKASIFGQMTQVEGFTSDLRAIHDKYKAAVGGRWRFNAPIGGPQYMVGTSLFLNAYIAQRQFKVGRVKAGWASAKQFIPLPVSNRGTEKNYGVYDAPWVDANRAGMGTFNAVRSGQSVSMTVANLIGNINRVADEANMPNIVYGNRIKQMRAAVLKRFGVDIDEANKGKK